MKKKVILGRPKLPKTLAKDSMIRVRVSEHDRAKIEIAARRAKQKLPDWVRNTLIQAAS